VSVKQCVVYPSVATETCIAKEIMSGLSEHAGVGTWLETGTGGGEDESGRRNPRDSDTRAS